MSGNGANGHEHLDTSHDSDTALQKIRTAGSISISPELFEKIYLSPQNAVKGELRKTFGNPTPLALIGFLLALTPLTNDLMNWRDGNATGNGAASIGAYFFFGAILMISGAFGEWIVGNTFPFVVFGSFGAFWGTFAVTLSPYSGSIANYAAATSQQSANAGNLEYFLAEGATAAPFLSSFAFFLLWMGVMCFFYMILALRTNVVFVGIFFTLVFAFSFLAAWFWYLADGNMVLAARCREAGGAFAFVTCIFGWWIWFAIMLAALDFPFQLPVGDLSTVIKSGSSKRGE